MLDLSPIGSCVDWVVPYDNDLAAVEGNLQIGLIFLATTEGVLLFTESATY